MSLNPLLESFGKALNTNRRAAWSDSEQVKNALEAAKSSLSKSNTPVEMWSTGSNIASIIPESVSHIPPSEVFGIMKSFENQNPSSPGRKLVQERVMALKPIGPLRKAGPETPQPVKKTVTFGAPAFAPASNATQPEPPAHQSKPPSEVTSAVTTPQTTSKVRSILSAFEDKIKTVTTPHLGKTPLKPVLEEPASGSKRKQAQISSSDSHPAVTITALPLNKKPVVESSIMDISFDGPILEIPDDLLAELNALEPAQREQRLSVLKQEAEQKRASANNSPTKAKQPEELPASGKVAAAMKLFGGTSVPRQDFGIPTVSSKPVKAPFKSVLKPTISKTEDIDGEEIKGDSPPFFDARDDGSSPNVEDDGGLGPDEDEDMDDALHRSKAEEAAVAVAEQEAAKAELEKSAWLADIEEIKIVSTPAKSVAGINDKSGDWSVVSQKMNLSCALTPVVPGRRSCVALQPRMIPLAPKNKEDQYDITDKDTDSEDEMTPNTRAKKHVPAWCVNWRQKAIAQIALDPESIFGVTVPKCDLDVIFTEENYRRMGISRPKRQRGSSGNWAFDKLTQDEVDRYRAKCGQVVKADGVFVE